MAQVKLLLELMKSGHSVDLTQKSTTYYINCDKKYASSQIPFPLYRKAHPIILSENKF